MKTGNWARRAIIILAVVVIAVAAIGCGQPGADGEAYIAYSWAVGPITIATNDPAFAGVSYIYNGEFRKTSPGVYDFEYTAWDDSYWWGWYEIYVNPGEDGGMVGSGEDGSDLYFEVLCLSTGPSFYVWEDLASAGVSALDTGDDTIPAAGSGSRRGSSEPVAVLGAGLPEVPDAGAAGAGVAAPGDASEPWEELGELGGAGFSRPAEARARDIAGAEGRGAATVQTLELPGYTVVFGFAGDGE